MASAGKVLIVVQNLPVPFDRRVWLEAGALREAGYQVTIISPTGKRGDFQEAKEIIDGIQVYRYPAPPEASSALSYFYEFIYSWLWTAWLSWKVWRRHGFEVFHACNPPDTFFLLGLFYKLFDVKFIFDHHDLSPEMYLAKGNRKWNLLYLGLLLLERLTFYAADVVITTNQSHKEIAVERGRFDETKVFIVRSGPDFERLKLYPPDMNRKNGFEHLACYLGEMCVQDGVDLLLRSIQILIHELDRNDTFFVLMGGGPELEDLIHLKEDLDLDDWVTFTGRVSDEELCRYLSTADICLDPDPYSEWSDRSTMNKMMEYMAFSKPIVAFDLTEHRRSAGEAAVYTEPNDVHKFAEKINWLLGNPEERNRRGEIGAKRVNEHLAWEYSVPPLLAAYEYAIAKG